MVGSGIRHLDEWLDSHLKYNWTPRNTNVLELKRRARSKSIVEGLANLENLIP